MHWLHNSGALPRILWFLFVIFLVVILTPLVSMAVYMFPQTIDSHHTPAILDLKYEKVSFTNSEGITLKGWFIPVEGNKENAPTIVFLHGYPAEKGDLITFAYPFHDEYNVFLFDFRALGESEGSISTLGYKEAEDVSSAIEYLRNEGHTNIGVWGFSMGAAAALLAGPDLEVKAIVADSSYAELTDMSRIVFQNLTPGGGALGDIQMLWARILFRVDPTSISPAASLSNIEKPVLISHIPGDQVIPSSQAEKLRMIADEKDNVDVWVHDTGGHGLMSVRYQKKIRAFFDEHLMN